MQFDIQRAAPSVVDPGLTGTSVHKCPDEDLQVRAVWR